MLTSRTDYFLSQYQRWPSSSTLGGIGEGKMADFRPKSQGGIGGGKMADPKWRTQNGGQKLRENTKMAVLTEFRWFKRLLCLIKPQFN